ncbi:hypothetical protein Fmac_003261 [Flemingia macrophylla]|uniref:Amino acid permease n=1 Tax=Flemingia macrophylla TaxID=520843 RepID=A0ABD1NMY2_9FABA
MVEETKNPARDIPVGLVGSMAITTTFYYLLSLTFCLMHSYKDIDVYALFSMTFHAVRLDWAKYIVALGVLKGMTIVLLVNIVGVSCYLTYMARNHVMPPWFGLVDHRTGSPVNATIAMVIATTMIVFFMNFSVLSSLLSISTLFIFMLVAVALLLQRYYSSGVTTKGNQVRLGWVCDLWVVVGFWEWRILVFCTDGKEAEAVGCAFGVVVAGVEKELNFDVVEVEDCHC